MGMICSPKSAQSAAIGQRCPGLAQYIWDSFPPGSSGGIEAVEIDGRISGINQLGITSSSGANHQGNYQLWPGKSPAIQGKINRWLFSIWISHDAELERKGWFLGWSQDVIRISDQHRSICCQGKSHHGLPNVQKNPWELWDFTKKISSSVVGLNIAYISNHFKTWTWIFSWS